MAEREKLQFTNMNITGSPMRDHSENPQVIEQKIDSSALDRIKKAEKGELKAKLAAILDRGIVQDRLQVDLPDDIHGEWVKNDPLEIRRLEALGFEVDTKYATKRAIHSDGSSGAIVGDVLHMICKKEIKEVIDEIRLEQKIRIHTKKMKGQKELNKEELEYIQSVEKEGDPKVLAYSGSTERNVSRESLAEIMESVDSQVQKHS